MTSRHSRRSPAWSIPFRQLHRPERTLAVHERFSSTPDLYAIAVVDADGIPLGIVNRFRFLELLSQPFGRDLFQNQRIANAMDASPLVIDEHTPIEQLSDILADDKASTIFDGFIFTRAAEMPGHWNGLQPDAPAHRPEAQHARASGVSRCAQRFAEPQSISGPVATGARQCGSNGRRLAVFYLDLDRFKAVNDGLGHAAGDLLLQRAAERFRTLTRAQDTVARMSGDEFAFVVSELSEPEHADLVARKLVDLFREPFQLDGAT